jgi:hypothetical protein
MSCPGFAGTLCVIYFNFISFYFGYGLSELSVMQLALVRLKCLVLQSFCFTMSINISR